METGELREEDISLVSQKYRLYMNLQGGRDFTLHKPLTHLTSDYHTPSFFTKFILTNSYTWIGVGPDYNDTVRGKKVIFVSLSVCVTLAMSSS